MVYRRFVLFVIPLCLFIASPLFAITRTWTGAVSANWSDPANWSPTGIPAVADSLVFPLGASHIAMTNDLPAGTSVGAMTFSNGYTLSGNALILMGNVEMGIPLNVDVTIGGAIQLSGDGGQFNGALDVNGQTFEVVGSLMHFHGPLNGAGTIRCRLITSIEGSGPFSGTITGLMNVSSSLPNATVAGDAQTGGSHLTGTGTVGNVTVEGNLGLLSPGNELLGSAVGVLHTKSLVLNTPFQGTRFDLVPGGSSDQVQVTGTVTLSGPLTVNIVSGTPIPGQTFVVIDNDGTDPVSGTFSLRDPSHGNLIPLPEGSTITVGTSIFSITYQGGDGNDVVLTAVSSQKTWTGAVSGLWSNPQNWLPQTIPVAGEPLVFPGAASHSSMTNDLPAGTVVGAITIRVLHYTLSGNALTLMGDVDSLSGRIICNVDLKIGSDLTILGASLDAYNGAIDVNGQTLTSLASQGAFTGPLNGTGTFVPIFVADLQGGGTFSGTIKGTVNMSGSLPNATLVGDPMQGGSELTGVGTIGNVTVEGNRGYLSPGYEPSINRSVGVLHTKSLVLNAPHLGTTFDLMPGGSSDQVQVTGTVTLSGPLTVNIVSGTPTPGQTFVVIDNDGSDPVSGTFSLRDLSTGNLSGLPEGSTVASGPYSFRISYAGGDGNDVQLTVTTETVAILTQSAGSTKVGESWTLTATVTSGFGTPTGSVAFSADGIALGIAPLVNGVATLTTSVAAVGSHNAIATVLGTGAYANSVSVGIAHAVIRGHTITNLASNQPNTICGQTARFTVTAIAQAPASGQSTGNVTIVADGVPLGTVPLVSGTASFETAALHAGIKSITATYSGDTNFEGSTATAIQQNVSKAQTEVDARPRTVFVGESPLLTVFVNVIPGSALVPTGAVSISEGGAVLSAQPLSGGAANVSLNPLAAGDHTLIVNYSGDTDFEGSSETIVQTVGAPGLSVHGLRVIEGNRGITNVSLVVSLSVPVSQPVRVSFSTVAGSATAGEDYESTSGVIEFAPGELTRTIELHVVGDTFPESDETFSVLLSNPVNATIDTSSAMIVIANDDQVPPRRRPSGH